MKFYGLISNQATAALISPEGRVDWLPLPRFDCAAPFARLLGGADNGFLAVHPDGPFQSAQSYLPGTMVLETRFTTAEGSASVQDYLVVGRPELRRRIDSAIPLRVTVRPAFGYGLTAASVRPEPFGAVFLHPLGGEALALALLGDAPPPSPGSPGVWVLPPGRWEIALRHVGDARRDLDETTDALAGDAAAAARDDISERCDRVLERTMRYWRELPGPDLQGPFAEAARRSALVLQALSFRTTGAIIAAPTTSLPEQIGGTRQWDYRFAWVRDGSYAAEALLMAGDTVAPRRFIEFLLNCVDLMGKPFPAPFVHVDGTLIRGERELPWLPGFRGSRPCREGNAATGQVQLDIEGDFLWAVRRYCRATGDRALVQSYWEPLRAIGQWVMENYAQEDASLWEFRGQDARYTHSQLMCWVTLSTGADLADLAGHGDVAADWREGALRLHREIEQRAWNPSVGSYVQSFGGGRLDAALLLMPLYGFCDARDARFEATFQAILRELVTDAGVYRYAEDMLGAAAHPFVLADAWLGRVHLRRGERGAARRVLERLVASATDLGLLGEHFDAAAGEPRGNFPQAFSHLGLLQLAVELERAEAGLPLD